VRSLRAFLFLCVGLCLGGGSVVAFAAAADYGSSLRLNAPAGSGARFTGAPIYDWADAPDGWGRMKDINKINIGGKSFDVTGSRLFSPGTLAKGAVSFARFGGPTAIGLTLAPLLWDAAQGWLEPVEDNPDYPGRYWVHRYGGTVCKTYAQQCSLDQALAAALADAKSSGKDYRFTGSPFSYGGNCAPGSAEICDVRQPAQMYTLGAWYDTWFNVHGQTHGEAPEYAPAGDQAIEDAIYVELVARGMGSDLARRLIEGGYQPVPDGVEADGPSSIPGDTTTTTTSGPAGVTSSTTNTTHNISYTTNTTNNTSTVTITNTTTTTTTTPDGTTTTETTEAAPEGSETEPPPEEKPFCELYPDASACAKLDVPAADPNQSEDVTVTLTPTGGFGAEGGSCPPPFPFVVQGRSYQISYAQACDFFSAVRPVVIAAAMLSALLIALGGYKRD